MVKRLILVVFLIVSNLLFFTTITFAGDKTQIYSKLDCSCCSKTIQDCNCPMSKEMKAYVDGLLDAGLNEEETFLKIAKKYSLEIINDKGLRNKIEKKLIQQAGSKRPQIFIKPLSYNLGKVNKSKENLKLFVRLKNKGNEILTINNLKTSCACTTVKLKTKQGMSPSFSMEDKEVGWKINLAPGEEGKLIITTDLNHPHVKVGHLLRTVQIESNDPVHPVTTIEFEAEIVK